MADFFTQPSVIRVRHQKGTGSGRFIERQDNCKRGAIPFYKAAFAHESFVIVKNADAKSFFAQPATEFAEQGSDR